MSKTNYPAMKKEILNQERASESSGRGLKTYCFSELLFNKYLDSKSRYIYIYLLCIVLYYYVSYAVALLLFGISTCM